MLAIISPAKTLDFSAVSTPVRATQPAFKKDALALMSLLRDYRVTQLKHLMKISDKLAQLNHARNQAFTEKPTAEQVQPAVYAFQGDVYKHLDVATLGAEQQHFLQQHAVILSGLYGVLRPFDLMQAYRLEMGTALSNEHGNNLLAYWGDRLTKHINKLLIKQDNPLLINLASNEYAAVIQRDQLVAPCLDLQFKVKRAGVLRTIGVDAKRARGAILRYWVEHGFAKPEPLQQFTWNGYQYSAKDSSQEQWIWLK